jgi:hypothetical protein
MTLPNPAPVPGQQRGRSDDPVLAQLTRESTNRRGQHGPVYPRHVAACRPGDAARRRCSTSSSAAIAEWPRVTCGNQSNTRTAVRYSRRTTMHPILLDSHKTPAHAPCDSSGTVQGSRNPTESRPRRSADSDCRLARPAVVCCHALQEKRVENVGMPTFSTAGRNARSLTPSDSVCDPERMVGKADGMAKSHCERFASSRRHPEDLS